MNINIAKRQYYLEKQNVSIQNVCTPKQPSFYDSGESIISTTPGHDTKYMLGSPSSSR